MFFLAQNITLDTYRLHDYFLYYSPMLLAATSVYLALKSTLLEESGDEEIEGLRVYKQ